MRQLSVGQPERPVQVWVRVGRSHLPSNLTGSIKPFANPRDKALRIFGNSTDQVTIFDLSVYEHTTKGTGEPAVPGPVWRRTGVGPGLPENCTPPCRAPNHEPSPMTSHEPCHDQGD